MKFSKNLNLLLFFIGAGILIYAIATDHAESLLGALGFVIVMFTVYKLITRVSEIEEQQDQLEQTKEPRDEN